MASEFASIASEIDAAIGGSPALYGFATYDDYAFASYGYASSGDKPFILRHNISSDRDSVSSAMSSAPIHFGGDGPESGIEGLYQGLTGIGYDQNCNAIYNSDTDVKPLIASASDPFEGTGGAASDDIETLVGTLGGYGFSGSALPIIIYATDNYLRDPEAGYGVPGGCPRDAGASDVVEAAAALDATLIGIATSSWSGGAITQMEELADATGSYADTDGDGLADDPLVFSWTGSSASFRTTIVDAILAVVGERVFASGIMEAVEATIEGDEEGFVTGIDSGIETEVDLGADPPAEMRFGIDFEGVVSTPETDESHTFELRLIGDDETVLGSLPMQINVPGSVTDTGE